MEGESVMATEEQNKNSLYVMALGAVGIVYGDIGTSPLYAIKECFSHGHYLTTTDNILGIISLIFWSIMIIVTFKYAFLIMRADNHGEGGILALSALSLRKLKNGPKKIALGFGLLGGALFFGDGVITPAISVLSALEGIVLVSPGVSHWVLPMAIVVLIFLFATQKHGTAIIGNFFGPIMMIWFFVIALLGVIQIIKTPSIIMALNPWYAVKFLGNNGWNGFVGLGSVILAVTGAEALYADMGHFGRNPIAKSWYFFILPSLVLSYFGQGAAILHNPAVVTNPFYGIVPPDFLIPMIVLSTVATVIASQSVISGMFSLTWQAVQMGYLPRMRVIHTSSNQIGQIFVPMMNFCMFLCTLSLVLVFKNSDSLASAYGFSVICIMMITTSLTIIVAKDQWEWSLQKIISVFFSLCHR
jgi:KUP system potassium uptake protein